MNKEEILQKYKPMYEYPSYYHESQVLDAMEEYATAYAQTAQGEATPTASGNSGEPTIPIADMELFVEWLDEWGIVMHDDNIWYWPRHDTYFDTTADLFNHWKENVKN